jgi:uncharacterized FlaG/YvyC family protein
MSINLRQQILQDKVDDTVKRYGVDPDKAFLRVVHSIITGKSIHDFDELDIVDGGHDKQLDIITIDDDGESADIYIVQGKSGESFSSNALVQLGNGLKWIFRTPRTDLAQLPNVALRDKIHEIRALQGDRGPSNIRVHVRFATLGDAGSLSHEFKQELKSIRSEYDNDTFERFTVEALGYDELTELSKALERQTKSVDANLRIKYDTNIGSVLNYQASGLKGVVVSVPAKEIATLVNGNPDGAIFDLNIRRYLGARGGVNKDIQATATAKDLSHEFWFLNNGITVVCDSFDLVQDPDNAMVKLKNLQIVNGCQTATTIALAQKEGTLRPDVRILARIYETDNAELVSRIVLTTNNQNQISSRDLRANEPNQLDMEAGFNIHGYHYERKPKQYDGKTIDPDRLFTNEAVGQAYLAVVLMNPSDARARKGKVWGELHAKVFSGAAVESYLIAAVLSRKAGEWLRGGGHIGSADDLERFVAKRGGLYLARIAAHLWRGSDGWGVPNDELKQQLNDLETGAVDLPDIFERSFQLLMTAVKNTDPTDPERTLKSGALDREIFKALAAAGKKAKPTRVSKPTRS